MSDYVYSVMAKAPFVRKFRIGNASVTLPGIPFLQPAASAAGVAVCTTTAAANMVGCNLDTATYGTTQIAGTDIDAQISIIINPDAVWSSLMSGGATEGTGLTLLPITTASTTGASITTASEWSNPTYDEGTVWGYDGANAGAARKITSVSGTAGTVTVPFNADTVVGDNFLRCPYQPLQTNTVQLTTLLTQADASIAVGTGIAARCVALVLNDQGGNGRFTSKVHWMSDDHILNTTT